MPRSPATDRKTLFHELLTRDLASLDPPVDLDDLVIGGRTAVPQRSWRQIADEVNRLGGLNPPIGHATIKGWYEERLDSMGVSRTAPVPEPVTTEPEQESA